MNNNKDMSEYSWIDDFLLPLTDILFYIEEIEFLTINLTRLDFFNDVTGITDEIRHNLIEISINLDIALDANPDSFYNLSPNFPWERCVKIGKAIESGYFSIIYQRVWWMATKAIGEIKRVVENILKL